MSFRILGLSPAPFQPLYGLSDRELAVRGVIRCIADSKPGYPDRVELRDAEAGEPLLLLNHVHQDANTPYRASHAIFVREGAVRAYDAIDTVPEAMRVRPLSLRAFDAQHLMVDADLIEGRDAGRLIEKLFADERVAYIQAHYAKRGCYAARIERA
jgi:hypothetical protein